MATSNNTHWNRLDNAAKIFPCVSNKRDTKVFRFSCQLHEKIKCELLQESADITMRKFPMFKVIIKKGFFWFYFEETDIPLIVEEEHIPVCSPLFDLNEKKLLLRISFYANRISAEVHHSLTDGTGALQFTKTLVANYLRLSHKEVFDVDMKSIDYDASSSQRFEDSFVKYYDPKKEKKKKLVKAYKFKGRGLAENRIKIIEGISPVKEVLALAKKNNTTMTVYICALLLLSIYHQMSLQELKKPVVISVPVNLRNYFDSQTARNFFATIDVSYDFSKQSDKLEDIIESVKNSFQTELTKEKLSAKMNAFTKLEKNFFIRTMPLTFKIWVLKIANRMTQNSISTSISNIGKIQMPEGMQQYIDHFSIFVSTKRVQFCVCSFGERLSISFTSAFEETDIQKRFFRYLSKNGVEVDIISNKIT